MRMRLDSQSLNQSIKRRREARPDVDRKDVSDEGRGRIALVTGASSGIGKAFAKLLAAKGYDVVVTARREVLLKDLQEELERRWGVRVHPLTCDLGEPRAATHLHEEIVRLGLSVDFLVNNAGFLVSGSFLDKTWDDHARMLNVMGVSVAELTHRVLPHMVEQQWGRVVNVASIGATFSGSPGQTLYAPVKAFVHRFSESIAAEYESSGIFSTASLPGATLSGITQQIEDYVDHNLLMQASMMRAEVVAREAYGAVMQGRRVIVHGVPNKIWAVALTHTPRSVRYALVKFVASLDPQRQLR
jgi:short-subunit dehydrogenase